jgi:hypothetical protein
MFFPAPNSAAIILSLLLGAAAMDGLAADSLTATNPATAVKTSPLPVVGVKDFLKEPGAYSGQQIVLQGFVTEVCRRKGCWALLHDSDPEAKGQVRVKQNEDGDTFKAFLPELLGKTLLVTGEVKETQMDNAYLDKWEANVRAAQAKAAKTEGAKTETNNAYDPVLKQISDYRRRVAQAAHGYLASYSLAVTHWETLAEKP